MVWWLQMLRSTIAYAQHERLMRDTGLQSKGIPLHRHSQRFKYVPRCVHNLTVERSVPFLTAFPSIARVSQRLGRAASARGF